MPSRKASSATNAPPSAWPQDVPPTRILPVFSSRASSGYSSAISMWSNVLGRGFGPRAGGLRSRAGRGWALGGGAPRPLAPRDLEHTLDNGLRVISSPDHGAPSVAVNLWYDVGSRHEEPGRTGFAHLFEHLMFQGSASACVRPAHRADAVRRCLGQRHHLVRPHQLLRDPADRRARPRAVAGGGPAGQPAGRAHPGEPGQPARSGQGGEAAALRQRARTAT